GILRVLRAPAIPFGSAHMPGIERDSMVVHVSRFRVLFQDAVRGGEMNAQVFDASLVGIAVENPVGTSPLVRLDFPETVALSVFPFEGPDRVEKFRFGNAALKAVEIGLVRRFF